MNEEDNLQAEETATTANTQQTVETLPAETVTKPAKAKKAATNKPAAKKTDDKTPEPENDTEQFDDTVLHDVDALAGEREIDAAVIAGMKAMNNWVKGKKMTVREFEKAKKSFLKGTC